MLNSHSINIHFFILFIITLPYLILADDSQILKGIPGVYVLINGISDEAEKDGLSELMIRKDVELKLRIVGIKVYSKDEYDKSPDAALNIQISKYCSLNTYAYHIRADVYETVQLNRDPSIRIAAPTWRSPITIGMINKENLSELRDSILDLVDFFVNEFLALNDN